MKIEIEVTENNELNAGWLGYLLGLPRPEGADEDGGVTDAQRGWDTGKRVPEFGRVRDVFTRDDPDRPSFVVRAEVEGKPKKTVVTVGE